jgi:phosphoadenosine phosphosulfate reductase
MTNPMALVEFHAQGAAGHAQLDTWRTQLEGQSPEAVLAWAAAQFAGRIALSSSLGPEDQVLTDMIGRTAARIPVFTLDTGRLFEECYQLIEQTEARYQMRIQVYFPDPADVEQMITHHGVNLFRSSTELRKLCCRVRKLDPLGRALAGLEAWVTGLRREQSVTRSGVRTVEWDETNRMIKINPLAGWDENRVWSYVRDHRVPYNLLHDRGFPSIGCSCCTRAVSPGADPRSGRWWWELPEQRECGLHVRPRPPVPLERPKTRIEPPAAPESQAAGGLL